MRSRVRMLSALATLAALGGVLQKKMPSVATMQRPRPAVRNRRLSFGSHTGRGTYNAKNNERKRAIPKGRKHRVRLRAHLRGETLRRPLTAHERGWL